MNAPAVLYESSLSQLTLRARGKVRDIYDIDDEHMLIVTTDRLSAFDVILPDPIPQKGRVLTSVSSFWFSKLKHILPNHLAGVSLAEVLTDPQELTQLEGRAVVVRKLKPLPVEAIVRGYIIGSGWKDYQQTGHICGIRLPEGLQQAQQLPEPIYTPSSKAAVGDHDENITFAKTVDLMGQELAEKVREASLALYQEAANYAKERGIIIADTKFEFGTDDAGVLYLIDEALTPDSSRFWPADQYQVGMSPPSFDKQYVRDYLETLDWNKKPPAPSLPEEVIRRTTEKYLEAEAKLIGSRN
ncbi:phosphoribosylaminoimidazolesuccinocarboxamide synthase [Methylotuvimicrobium sp. KM1]|uniref:phosphoribosylaminoimidazolesuccinocarboxamide synthase n=1 Tax=Methylotuvimicrobium sp. KM1 TaxID=3377707 RepID=UPI00384F3EC4